MKKKVFNWMLMAVLVVGLGTTVTACSDDDKDESKTPEQLAEEEEKANEAANVFWGVVGQLAGITNYTEDYKGMTLEPTIGFADEGNALQRIVATNSLAAAVERFNDLTGANITENTSSYEWKNDAVGTLTWTKGDSRDYATVDVNIKQMPKLQRIIYRDGEQMGTNSEFPGAAYYRFGDVIAKTNKDGKIETWVCVRPAFGPESKQDSHWICVDQLPTNNIKQKKDNWYVPTGLGNKTEHIRGFAEMIYAMLYPGQWAANLQNDEKLTVFHDFKHKNLKYHSAAFWQRVCKNWDKVSLFAAIFGYTTNTEAKEALRKAIANDGLNFLYNGYEWSWFGTECTLFQANYSGTNLKTEKLTKKEVDVANISLDFRKRDANLLNSLGTFFGDAPDNVQPRWVVRCATGKELATSGYNEKTALKGCEEIYRYYNSANTLTNLEVLLEKDDPVVGDIVGRNGKFYGIGSDATLDSTTPVGVVIYRGENAEQSWYPDCYGLALALEDVNVTGNQEKTVAFFLPDYLAKKDNSSSKPVHQRDDVADILTDWGTDVRGWNATVGLAEPASDIRGWIMADCNDNGSKKQIISENNLVSRWFLPTASQIGHAFEELAIHPEMANSATYGHQRSYYFIGENAAQLTNEWYEDVLSVLFMRAGTKYKEMLPNGRYWLATQMGIENNWEKAWYTQIGSSGYGLHNTSKSTKMKLRPVVAFRPNN